MFTPWRNSRHGDEHASAAVEIEMSELWVSPGTEYSSYRIVARTSPAGVYTWVGKQALLRLSARYHEQYERGR